MKFSERTSGKILDSSLFNPSLLGILFVDGAEEVDAEAIRSAIITVKHGIQRKDFQQMGQNLPKTRESKLEAEDKASDWKQRVNLICDLALRKIDVRPFLSKD